MIKKAPDGTEYVVLEPRSRWRNALDYWRFVLKFMWWRRRRSSNQPPTPKGEAPPARSPADTVREQPVPFSLTLDSGHVSGTISMTLHFVSPEADGTDVIRTVFTLAGADGVSRSQVTDNLPTAFFEWLVEAQGAAPPQDADEKWLNALRESLLLQGAKAMTDSREYHTLVINGMAREVITKYLAFTLDLALLNDEEPLIVALLSGLFDTEGEPLPPLVFTVPLEEFMQWQTAVYDEQDEMWVHS